DPKEPPGLGPEVKAHQSSKNDREHSAEALYDDQGPLFAVIPTFVIVGPLALLATLFPVLFGGLALLMRRWLVLLPIASLDSTLFVLHSWFRGRFQDFWWGSPAALWGGMTLVTLLGVVWSARRQRRLPVEASEVPPRSERILLGCMSLIGIIVIA